MLFGERISKSDNIQIGWKSPVSSQSWRQVVQAILLERAVNSLEQGRIIRVYCPPEPITASSACRARKLSQFYLSTRQPYTAGGLKMVRGRILEGDVAKRGSTRYPARPLLNCPSLFTTLCQDNKLYNRIALTTRHWRRGSSVGAEGRQGKCHNPKIVL